MSTCAGKVVVPLYSESAHYREWEVMRPTGEHYCIVDDNDTWVLLLKCAGTHPHTVGPLTVTLPCLDRWHEVPQTIDDFLTEHNLLLEE